jgi:hypothetical protein
VPIRSPARFLLALPLVAALLSGCSDDPAAAPSAPTAVVASPEPPAGAPAPEGIEGVIAVDGLTNEHTEDPVRYPTYPPVGGDHFPVWLNCGAYTGSVPDELAVHALEHGVVWIAYHPDVSPDDIASLQDQAQNESHLLVSPYPGLRAPFVLTAWGRQLDLDTLDDPRVQQFIDAYIRAGDAPEPGATCEGGITP